MMKRFSDPGGVSVGGGRGAQGTFQVGGLAMSAGERESGLTEKWGDTGAEHSVLGSTIRIPDLIKMQKTQVLPLNSSQLSGTDGHEIDTLFLFIIYYNVRIERKGLRQERKSL